MTERHGHWHSRNPAEFAVAALTAAVATAVTHHRRSHHHDRPKLMRRLTHEELHPIHQHVLRTESLRDSSADLQAPMEPPQPREKQAPATVHHSALVVHGLLLLLSLLLAALRGEWQLVLLIAAAMATHMMLVISSSVDQEQWTHLHSRAQSMLVLPWIRTKANSSSTASSTASSTITPSSSTSPHLEESPFKVASYGGPYHVDMALNGSWEKVPELSQSQDPAVDILQLNGIAKTAIKMFKGMELRVTEDYIEMGAFSVVPFLKVSGERYALNGEVALYNRRDLRKGKQRAYVKLEAHGGLTIFYKWDEPLAGQACDEVQLVGRDELHITTHLEVGDKSCAYTVVYHRMHTDK
mmetsp:Transcript_31004/g.68772  ORF Transcript_31004/g.68772 Transcript_31004/m.68772 type:complete len:354 (+) Transcript_31004:90-1151(+)